MFRKLDGRWLCLSTVKNPLDVEPSHILKVYRLWNNACSVGSCRTMCKNNLCCLNGLSPDETDQISAADVTTTNSSCNSRNCVGLKNYGSTCYLNAFLQIYFHFLELRRAVYELPPSTGECNDVIEQLQLIFGQMQLSQTGIVDPGGLIEVLNLSERDQQDAPEFHSLFMNLLETRFISLGRTVIEPLFKGTCVYETRCQVCGFCSQRVSSFLELDLKVSSSNLEDCISHYLAEELLTGDNRYACPTCCEKRDGVRRMRITETPLMLCFQLLRFTFDVRSGRRVKQKTPIRLPDILDMTDFVTPAEPNSKSPLRRLYRLSGVLLHLGRQSTSGHYIAVVRENQPASCLAADRAAEGEASASEDAVCTDTAVGSCDSTQDCWKICNDEQVFRVPATQFDLSKVNGNAQPTLSKSPRDSTSRNYTPTKVPPAPLAVPSVATNESQVGETTTGTIAQPVDSLPTNVHVSTTAYMLFYRRIAEQDEPSQGCLDCVPVPEHLEAITKCKTAAFLEDLEAKRAEQAEYKKLLLHRSALRAEMLSQLSIKTSPSAEISSPAEKRRRRDEQATSASFCAVPPSAASTGASLESQVRLSDTCLVPTQWLSDWLKEPEKCPPQLLLSGFQPVFQMSPNESSQTHSHSLTLCPHGHVPPDTAPSTLRAVSLDGLHACLASIINEGDTSVAKRLAAFDIVQQSLRPCLECIQHRVAGNLFNVACANFNKELSRWKKASAGGVWPLSKSALAFCANDHAEEGNPKNSFYWVGSKSLNRWRTKAQAYFSALHTPPTSRIVDGQAVPSQPPSTDFNTDCLCRHGRLLVDGGLGAGGRSCQSTPLRCLPHYLWQRLAGLFPNYHLPTYPVEDATGLTTGLHPCPDCVAMRGDLVSRAQRERELLADLAVAAANPANAAATGGGGAACVARRDLCLLISCPASGLVSTRSQTKSVADSDSTASVIYLVPMDFINAWRRFIRSPSLATLPDELPSGLAADDALCEHDHLLMPWKELLDEGILFPLSAAEWNILHRAYSDTGAYNDRCSAEGTVSSMSSSGAEEEEEGDDAASAGGEANEAECNGNTTATATTALYDYYPPFRLLLDPASSPTEPAFRVDLPDTYGTVCPQCYPLLQERRSMYVGARIRVRLIPCPSETAAEQQACCGDSQQPSTVDLTADKSDVADSSLSSDLPPDTPLAEKTAPSAPECPSSALRRSSRTRGARDDFVLRVDSSSKLQDIRVQMMKLIGVAPFDQHLSLDGVEFTDYSRTLVQLGIQPESLLYLWVDLPSADSADLERAKKTGGAPSSSVSYSRTSEPVETGFKGTRLLNSWSPEVAVSNGS
ncbi:hypothetical protein AAHC03_05720 [Spirometra sp. Aus1]